MFLLFVYGCEMISLYQLKHQDICKLRQEYKQGYLVLY